MPERRTEDRRHLPRDPNSAVTEAAARRLMEDTAWMIDEAVHRQIVKMQGLNAVRKNGESWKEWLFRQIDLKVLTIIILTLIGFGGYVRDARYALTHAAQQAEQASQNSIRATENAEKAAVGMADVAAANQDIQGKYEALEKEIRALKASVALAVTRPEFRSAVQQQILPRLARIEESMKGKP